MLLPSDFPAPGTLWRKRDSGRIARVMDVIDGKIYTETIVLPGNRKPRAVSSGAASLSYWQEHYEPVGSAPNH
jgi:hypothetical protein